MGSLSATQLQDRHGALQNPGDLNLDHVPTRDKDGLPFIWRDLHR